ncbi:MAG: protein kinase domain-containing protein [Pyrinomonadaceae bacterium]
MSSTLVTNAQLDRYVIVSPLGSGGMGEVYLARDTQIGRKVAIKVLPKSLLLDKERLRRFENEARTAGALNHPNILTVYDIGTHQGTPYLVTELLEGHTLRTVLRGRGLAAQDALNYATQIARGLAAAHGRGIVHRDLKPENLFITNGGLAKILDFGVAKIFHATADDEGQTNAPTVEPEVSEGKLFGTAGYMSPEQIRGKELETDPRSDIFSFGAVLFEMFTGRRAFHADSDVETMNAVLKDDPFDQLAGESNINPLLLRVIRRCLEKSPGDRFQSASDLSFNLELCGGQASPGPHRGKANAAGVGVRIPLFALLLAAALCALVGIGAFVFGQRSARAPLLTYRKLTFRRGIVSSARFTPDGQTVFYNAAWSGNPTDIFSARVENPEPRSLGLGGATVLSVSSTGEMAILIKRVNVSYFVDRGTLARVPLFGGTPREIMEDVQQADWAPDGTNLAVVRLIEGQHQLQFPIGNTIYQTGGDISYVRVSPRGGAVAFFDHPSDRDNRGSVAVIDPAGKKTILSGEWPNPQGLAWSPSGEEVWFTASKAGEALRLHAVTLQGQERVVLNVPQNLILHDISRDGRVLLTSFSDVSTFTGLPPDEANERDLSWLDRVRLSNLSADGKMFIFQYYGEGSGSNYSAYLRRTDGSPAVRLGEGAAVSFSPDGKWVLARLSEPKQLVLLPTGPGETRRVELGSLEDYEGYNWLPDGRHILFTGKAAGQKARCFVLSIDGGEPQPVTPEGIVGDLLSPNGKFLIAPDPQGERYLYSLEEGRLLRMPGIEESDEIIRWQTGAHAVFVFHPGELPIKIYRVDLERGRREFWKEVPVSDRSGLTGIRILLSGDGKSYVYQSRRHLSDLYVVEGLIR